MYGSFYPVITASHTRLNSRSGCRNWRSESNLYKEVSKYLSTHPTKSAHFLCAEYDSTIATPKGPGPTAFFWHQDRMCSWHKSLWRFLRPIKRSLILTKWWVVALATISSFVYGFLTIYCWIFQFLYLFLLFYYQFLDLLVKILGDFTASGKLGLTTSCWAAVRERNEDQTRMNGRNHC